MTRQIFTLAEARDALDPQGPEVRMRHRLKHYIRSKRLRSIARGVYAVVPFGVSPTEIQPDPFLAGAAIRPDAVFAYYSAIVLLGAARVEWDVTTILTAKRRPSMYIGSARIDFLSRPRVLAGSRKALLGVRNVDWLGRSLRVTGPERTLVDGFHQPGRVGGAPELAAAAAGFSVLDPDLIVRLLRAYDEKILWGAVGWFLERYQKSFSVPDAVLRQIERHRPKSRVYLVRQERHGWLAHRWNVMLPVSLRELEEPGER